MLKKIIDHHGIIFSTTATASSQRFLIANPFDQLGGRDRRDEIGDKPDKLDECGLKVR